ncbi:gp223 [Bacillus phage G]|uniref:Gp223 n=1 Tax=Bacillus phage G TaxID=2884420 RepID=G3M9W4_9CAUD|nr:gp223 [Bacillus phage G]AEO93482.1 gp223 [Bacillus phage G]
MFKNVAELFSKNLESILNKYHLDPNIDNFSYCMSVMQNNEHSEKSLQNLKTALNSNVLSNLIEDLDNLSIMLNTSNFLMDNEIDETYELEQDNSDIEIGTIEEIEYVEMSDCEYEETYVYDIGVEDNHNFFAENTLVHNCHHLPSNTMNEIARKAENAYYRIGVSATPWRDAGDDILIEAILSKRKTENSINASKLIDLGFLVPCSIYFVPMKQVFPGKSYHSVYKKAVVENDSRNKAAVKIAHKMLTTKQMTTLILIQQVKHGEILQKMLFDLIPEESFTVTVKNPKNGKEQLVRVRNIEFLSGQDDAIRRKAVIQAAKEKKVKVLIGSTIADEGLDIPSLDCLILLGGGKSSTRAFQRIGRVLRLYTDPVTKEPKKRAICFDFVDYTPMLRRHSRVREKLYLTEEKWEIKFFNPNLLNDD